MKKYLTVINTEVYLTKSDEFDKSSVDYKLTILASLNYWNLLEQVIKTYKQKYKLQKDKYILDQLKPTLQFLISHLRFGKNLILNDFVNQSLNKIISELKVDLTNKVENKYSIKTLVKSYLNGDHKEFKKQNEFFNIEFKKDITNELKERDLRENKPLQESYIYLYNFLNINLIPDYKKNNFKGYPIDMGMSYQVEYLVRFYLQNPSKENYLKAIQYAINIIYFDKEPYHKFFLFRMNFFEQTRTGQNEAITPAYTLVNAKVGASLAIGSQTLDLFITGSNLANETYFDHLSVTKPLGLNMMGRNVMFGLRLPFNFNSKQSKI